VSLLSLSSLSSLPVKKKKERTIKRKEKRENENKKKNSFRNAFYIFIKILFKIYFMQGYFRKVVSEDDIILKKFILEILF